MPTLLKRILPWVFSLAIVGYLFWSVDREAVLSAMERADIATMLGLIAAFSVLILFADAGTLWVLFKRLLGPLTFRDVLAIKGLSYFLNAITYSAGTGGIAYLAHRRGSVSFLKALSVLLWLNFADIIALIVMMSAGAVLAADVLPADVKAQVPMVLTIGWLIIIGALIYWRLGINFLILGPCRSWRIFSAFGDAELRDYVVMVGLRICFIGIYVLLGWLLLPTFDITIELETLLIYMPIITFVQIIPASISGLGAVQVVIIALYAPHVMSHVADPAAQVLAFSTVIGPATTLVRIAIGYCFMQYLTDEFRVDPDAIEALRDEHDG